MFEKGQLVIITLSADNPTGFVIFEARIVQNFLEGDSLLYVETRHDSSYRTEMLNTSSKDFISVAVITKDSVFAENVKLPVSNALLAKMESIEAASVTEGYNEFRIDYIPDGSKVDGPATSEVGKDFNPEWRMGEGREGER